MFSYFTLEEVSVKSGLTIAQILRLGKSGDLVFSVLENKPQNYEEVNEEENKDGTFLKHTKTNATVFSYSSSEEHLKLRYIATQDLINIVTNESPNRKTFLNAVFYTRNLDPKKGKLFLTTPMKVSISDVLLSASEWNTFIKNNGKNLKRHVVPLSIPEKVTFSWLWNNLSVGMWLKTALLLLSILSFGLYLGQSKFYEKFLLNFSPENKISVEKNTNKFYP